jgi:hypothetical protein
VTGSLALPLAGQLYPSLSGRLGPVWRSGPEANTTPLRRPSMTHWRVGRARPRRCLRTTARPVVPACPSGMWPDHFTDLGRTGGLRPVRVLGSGSCGTGPECRGGTARGPGIPTGVVGEVGASGGRLQHCRGPQAGDMLIAGEVGPESRTPPRRTAGSHPRQVVGWDASQRARGE